MGSLGIVHGVRWGPAVAYGLGAAFVGGLLWGFVAALTGYIFILGAIAIGVFVAWAARWGGRRASPGLIALAFVLTLFAVYVGEITSLSILAAPYGVGPGTIVARYFSFVAEFPADTLPSYLFGLIGAGYAAYGMWSRLKTERLRASAPTPFRTPVSAPAVPFAPAASPVPGSGFGWQRTAPTAQAPMPTVRVLEHKLTRAAVEVSVPAPDPHVVVLELSNLAGGASVLLDGKTFLKTRVLSTKSLDVPLGGEPPRVLSFYLSTMGPKPRVEVYFNHLPLSKV